MNRGASAVIAVVLAALAGGCADRTPPRVVDGVAYGTTRSPFRGRWWHYYERGVSWADGGFWAEAEADLRQCLQRRSTDSRRARAYGFHFVQCFAHRELGAALLARGRVDEAERELRTSLAQEPSAKAEFLLQRIAERRGQVPPAGSPPPAAQAVVIDRAEVRGNDVVLVGHWRRAAGQALWLVPAVGAPTAVATGADDGFTAAGPGGSRLAVGAATTTDPDALTPVADVAIAAATRLALDGPVDGDVVREARAWWRWRGESAAGLARLRVVDGGAPLREVVLTGVRAGGMIDVPLAPGEHALAIELVAADGTVDRQALRLIARPAPSQDRRLRATAVLLPLLDPRPGQAPKAEDDLGVQSAVVGDARLRLVDRRVDGWLRRELALADAGWIAPGTAARAGRGLGARYSLIGTVQRGRSEIECWLRLVRVDSGEVVAAADAYGELRDAADEDAFYAAVAARLRHSFPVLDGALVADRDGLAVDLGRRDGVVGRMRFHVLAGPDTAATDQVEVERVAADRAAVGIVAGSPRAGERVVSE